MYPLLWCLRGIHSQSNRILEGDLSFGAYWAQLSNLNTDFHTSPGRQLLPSSRRYTVEYVYIWALATVRTSIAVCYYILLWYLSYYISQDYSLSLFNRMKIALRGSGAIASLISRVLARLSSKLTSSAPSDHGSFH
jgi:hypothetical protein